MNNSEERSQGSDDTGPITPQPDNENVAKQRAQNFLRDLDRLSKSHILHGVTGRFCVVQPGTTLTRILNSGKKGERYKLKTPLLIITKSPDEESGNVDGLALVHADTETEKIEPYYENHVPIIRYRVSFTKTTKSSVLDLQTQQLLPPTIDSYLAQKAPAA